MPTKSDASHLTLSQAILSPINSILQAQVHASRSFLNLVLQMGFKHNTIQNNDENNKTLGNSDSDSDRLYFLDFEATRFGEDGSPNKYKIKIPTLAMLPLNPLTIDEAEIQFDMTLSGEYSPQRQFSTAGKKIKKEGEGDYNEAKRPWYIIDEPVDLYGTIGDQKGSSSKISVKLKIGKADVPPELNKFIASTGDFGTAEKVNDVNNS